MAKAATALGVSPAHLAALLNLTAEFAAGESRRLFASDREQVHLWGIATALFVQLFGRHVHQSGTSDHWPHFQGGNLEPASEAVELNKTTPSRSRSSTSKSGALPLAHTSTHPPPVSSHPPPLIKITKKDRVSCHAVR